METKNKFFEHYEAEKKLVECKRCKTLMSVWGIPEKCPCGSKEFTLIKNEKLDVWVDFCQRFIYYHQEYRYSSEEAKKKALAEMMAFGLIKNVREIIDAKKRHIIGKI